MTSLQLGLTSNFRLQTCLKPVQVVRHENEDKANQYLKRTLLLFFPAGAGAVNASEELQSPLRCTSKLMYFKELTQDGIQENYF